MKSTNRWLFMLLFLVMILFLMNLDKLLKEKGYSHRFYYREMDSARIVHQAYDVISQDLTFRIYERGRTSQYLYFKNSARIKIKLCSDNIDTIKFNLTKNWQVTSRDSDIEFFHEQDQIYIPVASRKSNNDEYIFNFDYEGRPISYHPWCRGLSHKFLLDSLYMESENFMFSTLSVPFGSHTWFLCKDNPADKIDTLKISIDIPDPMIALANGSLTGTESNDGRTIYHYRLFSPVSPHLAGIFAGPFRNRTFSYSSISGFEIPVQIYWETPVAANQQVQIRERLIYILSFFENKLGAYPFGRDGLKIVQQLASGGMEFQSGIGLSEISARQELLMAYEIARQWMGTKITTGFQDIWLSESLTTYLTAMYIEKTIGKEAFYIFMNERKNRESSSLLVKNIFSPDSLFADHVGHKGAWVIHMMRQIMGDNKFEALLGLWAGQDPLRIYHTDDFFALAGTVHSFDWNRFKEYWVRSGRVPLVQFDQQQHKMEIVSDNGNLYPLFLILDVNGKKIIKNLQNTTTIPLSKLMNSKYPEELLKDYLCNIEYIQN